MSFSSEIPKRSNGQTVDVSWWNTIRTALINAFDSGVNFINGLKVGASGALTTDVIFEVVSTAAASIPAPKMTGAQRDAIGAPIEGMVIYNTDTNALNQYDGSGWVEVGSGGSGSGGINYLTGDNTDFESGVGDWIAYADAAAATPADGTGGSPTTTVTRTTTSGEVQRGTGSLEIAKDASNRQGEGASVDFAIDPKDEGALLEISFDYQVSANYASGDIRAFIYDVDGASVIAVLNDDDGDLMYSTNGRFIGRFQSVSGNNDYRLILHITSTNASAYDVYLDNAVIGPQQTAQTVIASEWESFTPTGSWSTNTTYAGQKRRVGDSLDIQVTVSLSGAPDATEFTLTIPDGLEIDISKIAGGVVNDNNVGQVNIFDNDTAANRTYGMVQARSTTTVAILPHGASSVTQTTPFTWATDDHIFMRFLVPIENWGNGTLTSTTENLFKNVFLRASATPTGTLNSSRNTVIFGTKQDDSFNTYNTSTGVFTAPFTGWYFGAVTLEVTDSNHANNTRITLEASIRNTTTSQSFILNANNEVQSTGGAVSTPLYVTASGLFFANKGDSVEAQAHHDGGSPAYTSGLAGSRLFIASLKDLSAYSIFNETNVIESTSGLASFSITAGQWGDLTSIDLPPGEWDVSGQIVYFSNGATTTTQIFLGISSTSGNDATGLTFADNWIEGFKNTASGSYDTLTMIPDTVSPTTTTTYYLKARAGTSISNLEAAYKIKARKIK